MQVHQEDDLVDGGHNRELNTRAPPHFANDYGDGYGPPPLSGGCDAASMAMPMAPSYNEEEWRPPPEPPRMVDPLEAERELPPPPHFEEPAARSVPDQQQEFSSRVDVTRDAVVQRGEQERFLPNAFPNQMPGSFSNRIPGLDEPILIPSLAGSIRQAPGPPPPVEPYSTVLQPHMLATPQQLGNPPFRIATGSSAAAPPSPSPFQTQLPSHFQAQLASQVTVPPMSAVSMPASVLTVPPSGITVPPSGISLPPVSGCSPPNSYHLRPHGSPYYGQIGR